MNWSDKALYIWLEHYMRRDLGEVKPEDTNARIVNEYRRQATVRYGENNKYVNDFFNFDELEKILNNKEGMFNSPTYYNFGINTQEDPMIFACWIAKLHDSMEGIMKLATEMALIFKHGGGCGAHVGELRPSEAVTSSSRIVTDGVNDVYHIGPSGASGPISFMELFNVVGRAVKSGGKRRAAILMSMAYDHPDILEFISCKRKDPNKYENMNISVLTDSSIFQGNKQIKLQYKGKDWGRTISSSELVRELSESAHMMGDPGVFFRDKIEKYNFAPNLLGPIVSSNPCGEIVSNPNTSCNLFSINMYQLALDNQDENAMFKRLAEITRILVPFMDFNIDIGYYPTEEYREASGILRNVGIGVAGFGELLLNKNIIYGSSDSQDYIATIMRIITTEGYDESIKMAMHDDVKSSSHYGEDWDNLKKFIVETIDNSHEYEFLWENNKCLKSLKTAMASNKMPRNRNISMIAPTGNTGIAMDAETTGMEPAFDLEYRRNIMTKGSKVTLDFVDGEYKKAKDTGFKNINQDVFVTAHDIHFSNRLAVQAAAQTFTSASISSTINLPENTTIETVESIYKEAARKEIKGLTIYRDNSRTEAPIEFKKDKAPEIKNGLGKSGARKNDHVLASSRYKVKMFSQDGTYTTHIHISTSKDGQPLEVFINTGKSGNLLNAMNEALGKVISLYLQKGGNAKTIIDSLIGIKDGSTTIANFRENEKPMRLSSIPDAVANILKLTIDDTNKPPVEDVQPLGLKVCPLCGEKLKHEGACVSCSVCSYARC